LFTWLLAVLLKPAVKFVSLEEKCSVDLVVRHLHPSHTPIHGLSTPAEVLSGFG
jgi:hypothetical protein